MADNIKMGSVVNGVLYANNGTLPILCTGEVTGSDIDNITQTAETPITFEEVVNALESGKLPTILLSVTVSGLGDVLLSYRAVSHFPYNEDGATSAVSFYCGQPETPEMIMFDSNGRIQTMD